MNILLGRQAILDRNGEIFAYELLFRSGDNALYNSDTEASASVLSNTLSKMSINHILGNKKGFVNIGIGILQQGLLDILPPDRFVIEILETQKPSSTLIEFMKDLKKKKYIFALDDFVLTEDNLKYWEPVLNEVDIVKVDVLGTSLENIKTKTILLKDFDVSLLAEKIETKEMFDICYDLGYHYFQGYFFMKPDILESPDLSPSVRGILNTIKIIQNDGETDDIEKNICLYPDLIISLLKIVNSASVSPVQEISSVKQSIVLLGKKALTQWLFLLLYSQKNKHHRVENNLLFLTAIQRAKMMELLTLEHTSSKGFADEAFLTGVLSLSNVLLQMPFKSIVAELKVSTNISDALLKEEGTLGDVLKLIKAVEKGKIDIVHELSKKLELSMEIINTTSNSAFKFANDLANEC